MYEVLTPPSLLCSRNTIRKKILFVKQKKLAYFIFCDIQNGHLLLLQMSNVNICGGFAIILPQNLKKKRGIKWLNLKRKF